MVVILKEMRFAEAITRKLAIISGQESRQLGKSMQLPTPTEMTAYLNRFVRGQARAKRDISVAIYNHYLSQGHRGREGNDLGYHHILILGPTGCGKTYMVKKLAEYLNVPFSINNSNSLVETGYRGRPVDDIVKSLLDRAGNNPRVAERGIIFLDEIDKIRGQDIGGSKDVSGEGVQNALLTLLDGRLVSQVDTQEIRPVDTSRLLFVCTGAFVGLQEIIDKRLGTGKKVIGFRPRSDEKIEKLDDRERFESLCQAQTDDLVEYGMIPEFIGRFATITALHELSLEDLRAIISESTEASPLSKQKQLARIHGIELEIDAQALQFTAQRARELKTGARGLHRLIGQAVDSVDYRWTELADEGICKVIITRQCIEKGAPPKLVAGPSAIPRIDHELRRDWLVDLPHPKDSGSPTEGRSSVPTPKTFTNAGGWTDQQIRARVETLKNNSLDWENTTDPAAREFWLAFENGNENKLPLVLRLCEELANRPATITDLYLAYIDADTESIPAVLHYMDYLKKKRDHEKGKSAQ